MRERRVRTSGRQVYGRAMPLKRPERKRVVAPRLNGMQQRLLILAIVLGLVVWGLSQLFKVTEIRVSAPGRGEEIRVEAERIVKGNWRYRNLLTLNDGELVSDLQQADPTLKQVEVRRQWLHGIRVAASLKQPSMGWVTGNERYLLDKDGTAIGGVQAASGMPVVNDGSNLPVKLGQRVATTRFVSFVVELSAALQQQNIGVSSMNVTETTLDLSVATNQGYNIVFDTSRGVGEQMADLKSVRALLASQKKVPTQYVDLRISGKAYYK